MAEIDGLTQRAAAKELGVSQPYVSKMLKEGKLGRLENGRIDPASVAEAKGTVGARKADSGAGGRAAPAQIAAEPPPAAETYDPVENSGTAPTGLPEEWGTLTYAEARRIKEANVAWLRHLEAQEKASELVARSAVLEEWEAIALHVRERLMGLAVKAATRFGLEPEQKDELDRMIREALHELDPGDPRH